MIKNTDLKLKKNNNNKFDYLNPSLEILSTLKLEFYNIILIYFAL